MNLVSFNTRNESQNATVPNAMVTLPHEKLAPVVPSEEEVELAREAGRRLAAFGSGDQPVKVRLVENGAQSEPVVLPAASLRLLTDILAQMADGNAVALLAVESELDSRQAADLLNVSQTVVGKLLDEHRLPYREVSGRRCLKLRDVLEFKKKVAADRLQVLQELAAQAQELNMGY